MALDILGLQEEANRLKEGNQNNNTDYLSNFVKFPDGAGAVTIRLLGPAAPGMFERQSSPFYQETRLHRVNNKSIHCLKNFDKKGKKYVGDCPICQYYNYLWQESEKQKDPSVRDEMQRKARAIKPVPRYYFNCIVRQERQDDGSVLENVGPKILSIGATLYKKIITGITGDPDMDEKGYGDVTDIASGRDFKIIKTIKKSGDEEYPNYDNSKFVDSTSPLGNPDQVKLWLSTLHDLNSHRILKPAEELKVELKKHLGLIKNDVSSGGFDPSEYTTASEETVVRTVPSQERTASAVVETVSSETVSPVANESDMDDDFFNTLKNIK